MTDREPATTPPPGTSAENPIPSARFAGRRRVRWGEYLVQGLLIFCASISVITTVCIVGTLVYETVAFFRVVSPWQFIADTRWSPVIGDPPRYGIWPLVCGTIWIGLGSGIIAIPIGLLSAIYLSEYASFRVRGTLKPALEVLAGIPSVVYGYFAIVLISPFIKQYIYPRAEIFNVVSASIVVGIMIVPMIVSLSEDVLRSVPRTLREAGYALGANKLQVTTRVVVPAAASGIFASFILAISRAIGETMAVTLAAGQRPRITWNPFESVQTMTAYIVDISLGDLPAGSIEYRTIFAVCSALFLMTLGMNVLSQWILARLAQKYD
jgi:phosphate transport system permease protein